MIAKFFNRVSFREGRRRYLNLKGIISKQYAYKGPDIIQIDLTDKCNSRCLVCWNNSPVKEKEREASFGSLDFSKVKDFIRDVVKLGTREVIFSGGGEPFCYPRIWEILEWTEKKGIKFHINTNFTLLGKEEINKLLNFKKLTSLTISIWSGKCGLYSKLHGRKDDTLYKLIDNIKYLNRVKSSNLYVKIATIVSNINYLQLRDLLDLMSETGCSNIEFGVCDVIPGVTDSFLLNNHQIDALKTNFSELLKYIKKKRHKIKIVNKKRFLKRISNPSACHGEYDSYVEKTPCYSGWIFLRLRTNGDFNSCLKSHRVPIGNLYRESIFSVWNNSLQQKFRRESLCIPKNLEYFKFIGNGNDNTVGCKRICDNVLANEYLHRIIKFLVWF